MPRNTRRKSVTIGIFGLAEVPAKTIPALLDDALADVEPTFIIPVTTEHDTKSIRAVLEYLGDNELDYEAVTTGTLPRTLKAVLADAAAVHKATDVGTALVNRLRDDDDSRLYVFFDADLGEGEDGGAYNALTYAEDNGVKSFDFANGLSPFDFGDEDRLKDPVDTDEDDDEDDDDEPEEKPVSKRTRRAPEPVDDDEDNPSDADGVTYEEAKTWGPRKLRDAARTRLGLKPGTAKWREIGGMSAAEVLDVLFPDNAEEEATGYHQTTLEEQIASAAHATNGAALPTQLNGDVATAFGQFWYLLAKEVAAQTVAEMIKKDLVDA